MFDALVEACGGTQDLGAVMEVLVEVRDPRAADMVWSVLAREDIEADVLSLAVDSLNQAYFGNKYYYDVDQLPRNERAAASAAAKQHLETGSEYEQFAALALLTKSAPQDLPAAAKTIRSDPAASAALRHDALQFQLGTTSRNDARETAIEVIQSGADVDRRLALQFLAEGPQELSRFRGNVYIQLESSIHYYSADQVDLTPPKGLEAAQLRPLVASDDSDTAAYASYFLALLENDGTGDLDRLIEQWQASKASRSAWRKLVYRAIAARNEGTKTDVLTQIYESFNGNRWEVREFYWTIRSMTGSEVLQLRKRIRDEVGMDELR